VGKVGDEPLEPPEGLFRLPLRKKDLPFSEKDRVFRLRLGKGLDLEGTKKKE
jgi:hypothetical protein